MTSKEPLDTDKRSFEEWLVEETNTTPEDIERAKKEAQETIERERREAEEREEYT